MSNLSDTEARVNGHIDTDAALELEVAAVKIPSPSFHEEQVADLFAAFMQEIGLDVRMLEVPHPFREEVLTRQPVGVLKGADGGPTLMINGHMDHNPAVGEWDRPFFSGDFEDGWIYGRGAQDDKGGIVASIVAAKALVDSGVRLCGDIWVCPVAGHKSGGLGTKHLIQEGWLPDYCINTENSGNGLARASVGVVKCDLTVRGTPVHFGSSSQAKANHSNAVNQIAEVAISLGESLSFVGDKSWLDFERCPSLPGYPALSLDEIRSTRYMGTVPESNTPEFTAYLEFQIRTVPGQTVESIRADLRRHLKRLKSDYPKLDVLEVNVPTKNPEFQGWDMPPFETPPDARLVQALANAHRDAVGVEPVVGGEPRLGAVGDGNILAGLGVEVVEYGPGDHTAFETWPMMNERIALQEIVDCARAIAVASVRLLGTEK